MRWTGAVAICCDRAPAALALFVPGAGINVHCRFAKESVVHAVTANSCMEMLRTH